MTLKRNRLAAGEDLEPRIMLSATTPAEPAQTPETDASSAPESEAAPESAEPVAAAAAEEAEATPEVGVEVNVDGLVITNPEGNEISASQTAIQINAEATVNNDGLISGGVNGVSFANGAGSGTLNNSQTGQITSDSRAVDIGDSVVVNNDGEILGTDDQRNGTVYSDVGANNFEINNSEGAVVDAGEGNDGAAVSLELAADGTNANIDNDGTIQGRGNAGAGAATAGDGIRLERTRVGGALDGSTTGRFVGRIENSGLIDSEGANGTVAGIRTVNGVDFQGVLDNDGTISGVQNGLYFGTGDHVGGVVNNDGTISSDSRALNIDGVGLQINNDGDILGTGNQRNGTVYADSTAQDFVLNNDGTIDAGAGLEGAGFSAELSEEGNEFVIDNSGVIEGRGNAGAGAAAAGDGIRLERGRNGGVLDGTTTGLFTGEINNSGQITSEGANGTVGGFRAVNGVSFQGELNNSGNISGIQNGVYFGTGDHTGGLVDNSGVISSDSRALNIDGTGLQIDNSGQILGTGNQRNGTVYADSTAQDFLLNNSGTIDAGAGLEGAGFSAELSEEGNEFVILNTGVIQGRGNAGAGAAAAGDGIRLERGRNGGVLDGTTTGLFTGTIVNAGLVSSEGENGTVGGFRAVNGVGFQGVLTNLGQIEGPQNGVYFGTGDHTGGVVNNIGDITSDSRAVNIDGDGLTLNNSGNIEATGRQRNGTVYVDGTADNFTINNSGSIDASGGAGSGVSVQVGSEAGDVVTGSINNTGDIVGAGDQAVDAGVRLFNSVHETTFVGNIINEGTISAEEAPAILVEDGVTLDGDIINSGFIDGAVSVSSGDIVLQEQSLVELDISSLSDVEQIDADNSDLTVGGTLRLNFENEFVPEAGTVIDVLDFASIDGTFTEVVSNVVELDTSNLLVDGTVTVLQALENGFSVEAVNQPLASLTTAQTPEELVEEAATDRLYFNIHTQEFPTGEIRGQLLLQSDVTVDGVRTLQLRADLDSAQEPGNTSDSEATGFGLLTIVDNGVEINYSVTLEVDGITQEDLLPVAGFSAIHIHNAPAGENGPVITDVIQDAGADVNGNALFPQSDTGDGDVFVESRFGDEVVEAPAVEAPAAEAPAAEAPAAEAPAAEAPAMEAPAMEAPAMEAPAMEAPAMEAPAMEAPAAEAPATEETPATPEGVDQLRGFLQTVQGEASEGNVFAQNLLDADERREAAQQQIDEAREARAARRAERIAQLEAARAEQFSRLDIRSAFTIG